LITEGDTSYLCRNLRRESGNKTSAPGSRNKNVNASITTSTASSTEESIDADWEYLSRNEDIGIDKYTDIGDHPPSDLSFHTLIWIDIFYLHEEEIAVSNIRTTGE